jgi:nucleotide-binding universal stress UspA family protein
MSVLLGYLPTPEGNAAFTFALAEAARRSTGLIIVNSARAGAHVDPALASQTDLDRLHADSAAAAVELEIRQPVDGHSAADDLIDASSEPGVEVTVIGLRRRTAVGKFVLGSNAQRVLMEAHTPVLTVKA